MENKKQNKEVNRGYFGEDLAKSPCAESSNSMTITKKPYSILWRPNNYRRQMKIKPHFNSGSETKVVLGSFPMEVYQNKHNKIITIKVNKQITLQLCKQTLNAIWSQDRIGNDKFVYHIEAGTEALLDLILNEKKDKIKDELDTILKKVAKKLKLIPLSKLIWLRHEDWIKGDEFIDNIPRECIIHDTVFKKVYSEGVEFFGGKDVEPVVKVKNYIKNRALENFTPEIVTAIEKINPLITIKDNTHKLSDILLFTGLVRLLTQEELSDLDNWLFKNFG